MCLISFFWVWLYSNEYNNNGLYDNQILSFSSHPPAPFAVPSPFPYFSYSSSLNSPNFMVPLGPLPNSQHRDNFLCHINPAKAPLPDFTTVCSNIIFSSKSSCSKLFVSFAFPYQSPLSNFPTLHKLHI